MRKYFKAFVFLASAHSLDLIPESRQDLRKHHIILAKCVYDHAYMQYFTLEGVPSTYSTITRVYDENSISYLNKVYKIKLYMKSTYIKHSKK